MIVGIFLLYIKTQLIKVQLEFTVLSGQNQMYDLNYKSTALRVIDQDTWWILVLHITHYQILCASLNSTLNNLGIICMRKSVWIDFLLSFEILIFCYVFLAKPRQPKVNNLLVLVKIWW